MAMKIVRKTVSGLISIRKADIHCDYSIKLHNTYTGDSEEEIHRIQS